jgi:hypothetical protein
MAGFVKSTRLLQFLLSMKRIDDGPVLVGQREKQQQQMSTNRVTNRIVTYQSYHHVQ